MNTKVEEALGVLADCDDALWAANAAGPSSRQIEEARTTLAAHIAPPAEPPVSADIWGDE